MADFATVQQLESRWRTLSAEEKTRAGVLIKDASAQVRAECRDIDQRVTDGLLDPLIPERVVCDMVKRAMLADVDEPAYASIQETAGPFSGSYKPVNPTGDLYLTKNERRLLGCSRARAFTIDLTPPTTEPDSWVTSTL